MELPEGSLWAWVCLYALTGGTLTFLAILVSTRPRRLLTMIITVAMMLLVWPLICIWALRDDREDG